MTVGGLSHVELLCPDLEASGEFFVDVLGLHVSEKTTDSLYLRCYGDWLHHTIVLTRATEPGLGHVGWAVQDEGGLHEVLERARAAGATPTPAEEPGQGAAWRFEGVGGHAHELIVGPARVSPGGSTSRLYNQPLPCRGRGAEPRRLDHVNVLAPVVDDAMAFASSVLGLRLREAVQAPDGTCAGAWMSVSNLVHDIAFSRDDTGSEGRIHHVAFWMESRELLMRAADLFVERGVEIEAGPGKHGVTQGVYLYFLEPSGNRVELFAGGYQILDPAWQPIVWDTETKDQVEVALAGFRLQDVLGESARPAAL